MNKNIIGLYLNLLLVIINISEWNLLVVRNMYMGIKILIFSYILFLIVVYKDNDTERLRVKRLEKKIVKVNSLIRKF